MTTTVAEMTKEEFSDLVENLIEKKLLEILGDPDEGLEIRETIRNRLLQQGEAIKSGKRGESFENVVTELGLE